MQSADVALNGGLVDINYQAMLVGFVVAALVGFVVAALVGIVALKLVLYFLFRARLKVFSFYLWLLAGAVAFGCLDLTAYA